MTEALKPENRALVERVLGYGTARTYNRHEIDRIIDAAREEGPRAPAVAGAVEKAIYTALWNNREYLDSALTVEDRSKLASLIATALAALSAPAVEGEAEPVAWRYRVKSNGVGWILSLERPDFHPEAEPYYEYAPLYAAPPAVEAKDASPPAKDVGEWVTVPREAVTDLMIYFDGRGASMRSCRASVPPEKALWFVSTLRAALAASPSPVGPTAEIDALLSEFAKPQFMTTTSGPDGYSLQFQWPKSQSDGMDRMHALHDAIVAVAKRVNGGSR